MLEIKALPNKEAIEFWKGKVSLTPAQFNKLTDEAATLAFGVSGIAQADELSTVFGAIQRSLEEGADFRKFKAECPGIFEKRGWTGVKAWRVDNIFRTNIQTAYNVGRYKQQMEVASERPIWVYDAVTDSRTRPAHLAMHGRAWPANHPVWNTWYPPNGYQCRCGVLTMSQEEAARDKIKVESGDPAETLFEPTDPLTGVKMPATRVMPDPGWSHNPGKTLWGSIAKDAAAPGKFEVPDWAPGPARYKRPALAKVAQSLQTVERLGAKTLKDAVLKDAKGQAVIVSSQGVKMKQAANQAFGGAFGQIVEKPYEIWLTPRKYADGHWDLARRYVFGFAPTANAPGGLAVLEATGPVINGIKAVATGAKGFDKIEALRRGVLIHKGK